MEECWVPGILVGSTERNWLQEKEPHIFCGPERAALIHKERTYVVRPCEWKPHRRRWWNRNQTVLKWGEPRTRSPSLTPNSLEKPEVQGGELREPGLTWVYAPSETRNRNKRTLTKIKYTSNTWVCELNVESTLHNRMCLLCPEEGQ